MQRAAAASCNTSFIHQFIRPVSLPTSSFRVEGSRRFPPADPGQASSPPPGHVKSNDTRMIQSCQVTEHVSETLHAQTKQKASTELRDAVPRLLCCHLDSPASPWTSAARCEPTSTTKLSLVQQTKPPCYNNTCTTYKLKCWFEMLVQELSVLRRN